MEGTLVRCADDTKMGDTSQYAQGLGCSSEGLEQAEKLCISELRGFQVMTKKSLEQPALSSMMTLLWDHDWTRELPVSLSDLGIQGL